MSSDHPDPVRQDDSLNTAYDILAKVPLIESGTENEGYLDGHNDFPYIIRGWNGNQLELQSQIRDMPIGQTDLARLASGRVGGQFWSAFIPCTIGHTDEHQNNEEHQVQAASSGVIRATLQQIDLVHTLVDLFPTVFALALGAADIMPIFRSGRIASLIGIEGLHQIGNSASVLRMYHRLGVRYITLCHDCSNAYADAVTPAMQPHGGLSDEGKKLLKEMNRVGIIADLSHTSEQTQKQALLISKAPLIFSHSSCYALCPHPRNVSDEVLEMLRENSGLIMICFLPSLTDPNSRRRGAEGNTATLAQVADHIVYAGEKIGYGHVGIGSDFDGMLEGPKGLDDTSCFPHLVAELVRRGVSEEDIKRVVGMNVIHLLERVESVAREMRDASVQMLCDEIPPIWTPEQRAMLVTRGVERKENRLTAGLPRFGCEIKLNLTVALKGPTEETEVLQKPNRKFFDLTKVNR